jgi:tRNA A37 threonylcarbamoyladenosine biosynthesis protein TsaE
VEKVKKEIDVYIVGKKEFTDYEEANEYEKSLQAKLKYKYHIVSYAPDLTEGKGYFSKVIIGHYGYNQNSIHSFMAKNFNEPIEMVMGVSPMDGYKIEKPHSWNSLEMLENFLNEKHHVGIGGYSKKEKLELILIDDKGDRIKN